MDRALLKDIREVILFLKKAAPQHGHRLSPEWIAAVINRIDATLAPTTSSRAVAKLVAWGKDLPSAPGHYLFVDDNAFTLFDAYPTVAAKPLEAARSYEVTIAATGPRVTTYRAGVHDTFDAQLLGPGVWYGPLPEPAGPLQPPAGGA